MASGHVNRTNRPNTWLYRPSLRSEDSSCQLGAVHTWPFASILLIWPSVDDWGEKRKSSGHCPTDVNDPKRSIHKLVRCLSGT